MICRRSVQDDGTEPIVAYDDLHEWVLSLPWVVERPYSLGTPGVRSFAVECHPLERRQLWLITGLTWRSGAARIATILPTAPAKAIESAGLGRRMAPMPGRQVLLTVSHAVELVVLTAYSYAVSQRGLAVDHSHAIVIGAGPRRREHVRPRR